MKWRALLAVVLAGPTLWVAEARADEPRPGPAYQLRLELDLPIILIGGGIASGFAFMSEAPGVACAPSCDKSTVFKLDRFAAGWYDPNWGKVGDIATASTLAAPLIVVALDQGLARGLNDDLVIAEAALISSALPAMHDSPVRMVPVASMDYAGLLVRGAL